MTGPQKRAGDDCEREALNILSGLLGAGWVRQLGAGRKDDMGDLRGPDTIVQVSRVKDWHAAAARANAKAEKASAQQARSGATHGATLLHIGGPAGVVWRIVLTYEQHNALGFVASAITVLNSPARWSDSLTITLAPDAGHQWWRTRAGLIVTTVHDWAMAWREAT